MPRSGLLTRLGRVLTAAFIASLIAACGDADDDLRDAGSSDAQVRAVGVHATGCGPTPARASGLVVAPGLILTAAHPIAGAATITIELDDSTSVAASIAAFDPWMDLAYLRTDSEATTTSDPGFTIAAAGQAGGLGQVAVFRDGSTEQIEAEVLRRLWINTEDIYVEGRARRPSFDLAADIEVGDSGSAVIADGEIIGVVWARVRDPGDMRAYAIDITRASDLVESQLASGDLGPTVDPDRCRWDPPEVDRP